VGIPFFLSFAIELVKSVQMAGILQVFAFLIVPALIGKLFTKKPLKVLIGGWLLGFLSSSLACLPHISGIYPQLRL